MLHKNFDKMQTAKSRLSVPLIVIALSTGLLLSLTTIMYNNHHEATAQKQSMQESDVVTIQNTSMSFSAPNSAVNKSMPHQIVVALPLRQDRKIWTGTVTFTATSP